MPDDRAERITQLRWHLDRFFENLDALVAALAHLQEGIALSKTQLDELVGLYETQEPPALTPDRWNLDDLTGGTEPR